MISASVLALALSILYVSAETPLEPHQSDSTDSSQALSPTTNRIETGQKLFQMHCAPCHGPRGEGAKGPTLAVPKLPRASDDQTLMRIIREGLSGTEMPPARMEAQDLASVAGYVKTLGQRPVEKATGDPKRGADLYSTTGQCAKCHTINGYGGALGPDLTDVGRRRSIAYLRRALLDPEAEVPQSFSSRNEAGLPQNFLMIRVRTRSGDEYTGARINEDTFSIQIREATGKVRSFYRSELAELHKDWGKSPMPNYSSVFKPNELDDLIAYLVSLREQK